MLDCQRPSDLRALLVDDDDTFSAYFVSCLSANGMRVERAADQAAAWPRLAAEHFDVMVLDRRLPDGDGTELVARLGKQGNVVPILMLTGYPEVDHACLMGRLGVTRYAAKPLYGQNLVSEVRLTAHAATCHPWDVPSVTGSPGRLLTVASQRTEAACETDSRSRQIETIRTLAVLLTDPTLNLIEFTIGAELLRSHACGAPIRPWAFAQLQRANAAGFQQIGVDRSLCILETLILEAGSRWSTITPLRAAQHLGISTASLWRMLQLSAGMPFHALRRTIVVKSAVPMLSGSNEHIRQIAYACGYEHHSTFDRDVRGVIGLSPTRFRSQLR
jgi:DNA-binding response OmpR family regulator